MSEKISIPMEFDVEDIWSETLGSGWEESPWFVQIKYEQGGSWDKPSKATLWHWDKEEEEKVVKTEFTPEMLVKAYAKLVAMRWTHCGGHPVDDQDWCTSDSVLQHMVYDDWIYG